MPSLIKSGCKFFFVATTDEAIQLRKINKKICIFILNGLIAEEIDLIRKFDLTPVINNLIQLKRIEKFQDKKKLKLNIALHFDTGMSRLGFDRNETQRLIKSKASLIKKSNVILVMSHLSCADNENSKLNKTQLELFNSISMHFPNCMHSLANSAGILLGKKYHFDMVRPGISLYGGHSKKMKEKSIMT